MTNNLYKLIKPHKLYGLEKVLNQDKYNLLPDIHKELFSVMTPKEEDEHFKSSYRFGDEVRLTATEVNDLVKKVTKSNPYKSKSTPEISRKEFVSYGYHVLDSDPQPVSEQSEASIQSTSSLDFIDKYVTEGYMKDKERITKTVLANNEEMEKAMQEHISKYFENPNTEF